jgi:hypothetical protein
MILMRSRCGSSGSVTTGSATSFRTIASSVEELFRRVWPLLLWFGSGRRRDRDDWLGRDLLHNGAVRAIQHDSG